MALWIVFWLSGLLTWVANSTLWMKEWYYVSLSLLGITSLLIGVGILATTKGQKRRSIVLIVLGLCIGQWWLVEQLAMMAFWSIEGFAP